MSLVLPLLLLLLSGEWVQGQQNQAQDKYSLEVKKFVTVQEGLCVFVSCNFSSPKSKGLDYTVYGSWYTKGTNTDNGRPVATSNKSKTVQPRTQDRFQLVGDPKEKNCSLMIRDVQREDSREYFFRMEKLFDKYNFMHNGFFLQVEALTQKPDIFIPKILEPGQPVTVLCVFNRPLEGCSAPSFSWRGAEASSQESTPPTPYFSMLTFIPQPQHHDNELTCQVDFPRRGVSTQRTVRMNVAYAPRDLVISIFQDTASESQGNISHPEDLQVHQGQALQLLCAAVSEPPAILSWVLEDRVLSWSSPLGSRILRLELPEVKSEDSGRYTCQAENRLGSQQRTLNLSVLYAPEDPRVIVLQENRTVLEILGNDTSLPVLESQSLRLVCVTRSNPPARLNWTWESQTLSPALSTDPGVLELPLIQWEHGGKFTCCAQNPLGAQCISLSLFVHYSRPSSTAFSSGVFLGTGVTALLTLCLIMILMKMLWKKRTREQTSRPKILRGSTILEYINVVPKSRSLARNREAKPSAPSRTPPRCPESKQKENELHELHRVSPGYPESKAATRAPDSENENDPDELHYAHLHFPCLRTQDTQSDYAEVRFH